MNLIIFIPSTSSTPNFNQPLLPFFIWEFMSAYLNNILTLQFLVIFLSFNHYSLTSHYGQKGFKTPFIDTHTHTHTNTHTPLLFNTSYIIDHKLWLGIQIFHCYSQLSQIMNVLAYNCISFFTQIFCFPKRNNFFAFLFA